MSTIAQKRFDAPFLRLKRQARLLQDYKFGETEHPLEDCRPIAEIRATVGDRRTAPIRAVLLAATFPCRGRLGDLARLFFRRSLFSPTLRTAIFVAMNIPQGCSNRCTPMASDRMAAYMRSMFQRLGPSDPGTCRLSRNEAVMARQI